MPDTNTLLTWIAIATGAGGLYNSLRKSRVDEETSSLGQLSAVVNTLRTEVDRITRDLDTERAARAKEREEHQTATEALAAKHKTEIDGMQAQINEQQKTINRQAGEITLLKQQIGAA